MKIKKHKSQNHASRITHHLSRNASDRILKIHHLIGAQKYPNTVTLARELEVSQKTIKRDIQFMIVRHELPIQFDHHRRGYFYSEPTDKFPGIPTVTEAEMSALLVGSKSIAQYQAIPYHKPFQMAFQKLTAHLNNAERYGLRDFDSVLSFRPFAPEVANPGHFETIAHAVKHHRTLSFDYRKPGEKLSSLRHVHPYHLICNDNVTYLIAYDQDRSDWRTFALNRICCKLSTGDKFKQLFNFDLNKYLAKSFTMLKGEGDFDVVIEFDAWATDMIRGRLWHATQQLTELPAGGSRLRLHLGALEEIERWVLSWGTHVTIIKPDLLADRVGNIARELGKRYPNPTASP
jgi:proteasome accessory factor B